VEYPRGDEHEESKKAERDGKLVRLKIPRRIWADDMHDAARGSGGE
ncbi:MAG: hypothetical protein JNL38_05695, partial [Myxococcales bacterium]|nr:hypothetical protein [Myxococcales bacterium]